MGIPSEQKTMWDVEPEILISISADCSLHHGIFALGWRTDSIPGGARLAGGLRSLCYPIQELEEVSTRLVRPTHWPGHDAVSHGWQPRRDIALVTAGQETASSPES